MLKNQKSRLLKKIQKKFRNLKIKPNGALRSAVVLNLRRTLRNRLILSAYSLTRQLSAGREEAAVVPEAIRELLVFAG